MNSVQFQQDTYYELRSPSLPIGKTTLFRGDVVLCAGIVTEGNKRYANLHLRHMDGTVTGHKFRVSRFNRGQGEWRELNPMVVVALADKLP